VWCEMRSLTLRDERGSKVFENRIWSKLFEPKCGEVIGRWTTLYNDALNNVISSSSIIRLIRSRIMIWAGHVERMGKLNRS
jgi:hypothetical protein